MILRLVAMTIKLPETGFQGNSFVKQLLLILQLNTSTFNSVWERNPLKLVAVFSEEIALAWLSFKLSLECIKQLAVVFLELGSVSRLIDSVVWISLRQRQS